MYLYVNLFMFDIIYSLNYLHVCNVFLVYFHYIWICLYLFNLPRRCSDLRKSWKLLYVYIYTYSITNNTYIYVYIHIRRCSDLRKSCIMISTTIIRYHDIVLLSLSCISVSIITVVIIIVSLCSFLVSGIHL